jgi:methionyl-tRNA synthetase
MSKIAYCSIQEAWGIDYDELHNPNTNISNEQNINNNNNKDDEIKELEEKIKQLELQYETLLKKRNFDQIKSKQEQILQKNNNYLEHFAPFDQTNNNQNKSNIFDLMFLVLIGIFIIYVLDNIFTIKKIKK